MAKVEIYSKDYCPYCVRAKQLFKTKGVDFVEYDITNDRDKFEEMKKRSEGRKTVPQIFVNDTGLGGFDDINHLDQAGKLDALLSQ